MRRIKSWMTLAAQELRRTTTMTAVRMPAYRTSAIRDSSHAMKVPLVQRGRLHSHVCYLVSGQKGANPHRIASAAMGQLIRA
jgi:hypothetical protein